MHPVRSLVAAALLAALCGHAASAQNVITYHVEPQMADKALRIRVDIPRVRELTVRVQMPVWMPGAYFTGNFATTVADVSAVDTGEKPLRVTHPDPNTWEVGANGAKAVQVRYTVKGADLELAGTLPRRGHISGPRTYMYVVGRKNEPAELDLQTPAGATLWNIATSLDPVGAAPARVSPGSQRHTAAAGSADISNLGSNEASPSHPLTLSPHHLFKAPTYDVLADAPVEMGDFAEEEFQAGGKPHRVVLYGQYEKIDRAKLVGYCKRIAETETAFFGDAPFARYVFEFRTTSAPSRGAGGLEHLGSTEIGTLGEVTDRTRSVIAHEYFHLWNVKRIRPFVLGPFNYVDPPHTANLWWSEGVTSYYGDLLSLRGGLNTRDEYLKHVGDTIAQLMNNPARLKVSADESSLRVWEANNSQGYGGLSYYTKGELIGLCLDVKIRSLTGGRYSLDDVMRSLWTQCRHGEGAGFEEDDIKKTVNRVSGADLSDFYDRVARTTEELPFDECLGYAGLSLARVDPPKMQADTGMTTRPDRDMGGIRVVSVTPGGAAESAGVKPDDRIVAMNGNAEPRGFFGALADAHPGDKLKLTIERAGTRSDLEVTLGSRSVYQWTVTASAAATPDQIRLRDQWLGASRPTAAPSTRLGAQ
jgi:predicted metalloprotease with PDZ domain